MKYLDVTFQGWRSRLIHGRAVRIISALGLAAFLVSPTLSQAQISISIGGTGSGGSHSSGISQLDYIKWLVQASGETSQFGRNSRSSDYINWAKGKGMNPYGGWSSSGYLTKSSLARTLVQFLGLNSKDFGGDNVRTLLREGIRLPSDWKVTRIGLAQVLDETGFRNRIIIISRKKVTPPRPGDKDKDRDDDDDDGGHQPPKPKPKPKHNPHKWYWWRWW